MTRIFLLKIRVICITACYPLKYSTSALNPNK